MLKWLGPLHTDTLNLANNVNAESFFHRTSGASPIQMIKCVGPRTIPCEVINLSVPIQLELLELMKVMNHRDVKNASSNSFSYILTFCSSMFKFSSCGNTHRELI